MKNLRKPTRNQKKQIADAGLDWKNWLVICETEEKMILCSKKSGRMRTVQK